MRASLSFGQEAADKGSTVEPHSKGFLGKAFKGGAHAVGSVAHTAANAGKQAGGLVTGAVSELPGHAKLG